MAILRCNLPSDGFTIIPNSALRDARLSLKAKGLLAYILSHAVGYELSVEQIISQSKDGRDSIGTAIDELEEHGYLVRTRQRVKGVLGAYDYQVRIPDLDQCGKSATGADQQERENPQVATSAGFPTVGKPATKKTTSKKTREEEQVPPPTSAAPEDPNAGKILSEWIDYSRSKGVDLPRQVIGRYAAEIKKLTEEGYGEVLVKKALARLQERGLAGRPAMLAQALVDVQTPAERPAKRAGYQLPEEKREDRARERLTVAEIADRLAQQYGMDTATKAQNVTKLLGEAKAILQEESRKRSGDLYTDERTTRTSNPALEVGTWNSET